MKLRILLFILVLPLCIQAQDNLPDFSLGIVVNPASAFRTLISEGDSAKILKGERDLFERPKFGYTAGFTANWLASDKISLETGALYSNYGERIRSDNGAPFFPSDSTITKLKTLNHYHMIEFPLILKYYSQHDDPFSLYFKFGAAFGLHLFEGSTYAIKRTGGQVDHYKSELVYASSIPRFNAIAILGVGFEYMLNDYVIINASPTFRYVLKPIVDDNLNEKLFSLGVELGIQFGF